MTRYWVISRTVRERRPPAYFNAKNTKDAKGTKFMALDGRRRPREALIFSFVLFGHAGRFTIWIPAFALRDSHISRRQASFSPCGRRCRRSRRMRGVDAGLSDYPPKPEGRSPADFASTPLIRPAARATFSRKGRRKNRVGQMCESLRAFAGMSGIFCYDPI